MEQEAIDDIIEDTIKDGALSTPCNCPACALARIVDRQRDMLKKLSLENNLLKLDLASAREELRGVIRGER